MGNQSKARRTCGSFAWATTFKTTRLLKIHEFPFLHIRRPSTLRFARRTSLLQRAKEAKQQHDKAIRPMRGTQMHVSASSHDVTASSKRNWIHALHQVIRLRGSSQPNRMSEPSSAMAYQSGGVRTSCYSSQGISWK